MKVDDIKKLAMKGEMPADELQAPDWCLWFRLRDVYSDYAAGRITKDEGAERTEQCLRQYDHDCELLAVAGNILIEHGKWWRDLERTANAYQTDRTLDNADRFLDAVYGMDSHGWFGKVADTYTPDKEVTP